MDQDRFWELVDAARATAGDKCQAQAAQLQVLLEQLPPEETISFERRRSQLLATACHWDLWGAAYQLKGGCSNDGFECFLGWLLAQGRATFEAAAGDPDSLADHPAAMAMMGNLGCKDMLYVALEAYEARTGGKMPEDLLVGDGAGSSEPLGEQWDFDDDDEIRRRLPRPWALMT